MLVKEKPSTVLPPNDTVIPASPAAPPEAPVTVKPTTSNWNPATGEPKSYKTSAVPAAASKAPNVMSAVKHDEPSPLTTPHKSTHEVLSPFTTPQSSVHEELSPSHTPQSSYVPAHSSVVTVIVWEPRLVQSSLSRTIHSESSASSPAEPWAPVSGLSSHNGLPEVTDDFLTKVWSLVAFETPATAHPLPGSAPTIPITSKTKPVPTSVKAKTSSPLLKYVKVWSHSAWIASSALPWQTTYTSSAAKVAVNVTLSG